MMGRLIIACLLVVASVLLPAGYWSPSARAAGLPIRIVSNNMCTDQLLLALAEPTRIAALSPFAQSRMLSHAAAKAKGIPSVSGTSEDLLFIKPDLVLTSQFDRRTTLEFIRSKGVRVETFELVQTVDGVREQISRMGAILGTEDVALGLIERIDAAALSLRETVAKTGLRVLPLARRGWSAGRDTLIGDILRQAGLINASTLASPHGGFLSLEGVIALKPDLLLLSASGAEAEDNGMAMLAHPALMRLFPPERRIVLPDRLTVCGGPMVIDAMDALAEQLRQVHGVQH